MDGYGYQSSEEVMAELRGFSPASVTNWLSAADHSGDGDDLFRRYQIGLPILMRVNLPLFLFYFILFYFSHLVLFFHVRVILQNNNCYHNK